jgi:hypothetical protein
VIASFFIECSAPASVQVLSTVLVAFMGVHRNQTEKKKVSSEFWRQFV